jgi:CRP/FNR family cyclic AMP-dependent transcriptional regulator
MVAAAIHALATEGKMLPEKRPPFDAYALLKSVGLAETVVPYARREVLFSAGDPCDSVMYVRSGGIQLSVMSRAGREAIVATLGPGDFLGERALVGHPVRLETATAIMASTVLVLPKRQMIQLLRSEHAFSDLFVAHMLARNARLEADLVDQLFNSSEKRLARTLLMLARYGQEDSPQRVLPGVTQETLAEMVGTTRPRVNFFLNKFRKLGFIARDAKGLAIHPSLVTVVVHDGDTPRREAPAHRDRASIRTPHRRQAGDIAGRSATPTSDLWSRLPSMIASPIARPPSAA